MSGDYLSDKEKEWHNALIAFIISTISFFTILWGSFYLYEALNIEGKWCQAPFILTSILCGLASIITVVGTCIFLCEE